MSLLGTGLVGASQEGDTTESNNIGRERRRRIIGREEVLEGGTPEERQVLERYSWMEGGFGWEIFEEENFDGGSLELRRL